jgi:hypothetical protein
LNKKGVLAVKTKFILTIFTMLVLIGGCSSYKSDSSSNECINCQKLRDILRYFKEEEHAEKVILAEFKTKYGHEAGGEIPWEDFEKIVIQSAGCCASSPHPLTNELKEYDRLDCIREYLEKENIQRIAFYEGIHFRAKPEDWNSPWAEIIEPGKLNELLQLLREAMEKEKNRFANEGIVVGHDNWMQIITDKHKFIIPIGCNSRRSEVIRGIGWTSCKLRKKLTEWSLAEPVSEKDYGTLECVLENLDGENIQRIDFCQYILENKVDQDGHIRPSLECRPYGEITEPQKINKVLKLLRKALKSGENRIEEGKTCSKMQMQIVTDKHKYLIRVFLDKEAAYGVGWTSYELREKLRRWGFPDPK